MSSVSDTHEEVFHYTGAAGLAGILQEGTLWATHYAFLNDHEEYNLFFRERYPVLVRRAIDKVMAESPNHPAVRKWMIDSDQDEVAAKFAWVEEVASYATHIQRFEDPYVTSFCAASSPATARNGLLSQWRGYGKDGGYAIVFDTAGLEALWPQENDPERGMTLFWGNAEYFAVASEGDGKYPETKALGDTVVAAPSRYLLSNDTDDIAGMFTPLLQLACLMKHWGFKEENEVRFIIGNPSAELTDQFPEDFKLKPIYNFVRDGAPVPFMRLLEEVQKPPAGRLPIRRIIVGPHPDKDARQVAVKVLLEQSGYPSVPVHKSEIPYRGR